MKRPAVFFDRDNTLIVSDGYLGDPRGVVLVEGAAEAIARARQLGYATVVFSNQSGVARGIFSEEAVHAVNQRMDELLQDQNPHAVIDRHEYCPYHPDAAIAAYRQESELRKPKPGMIYQAAERLALDLSRSWVIGDAPRDIEAGKLAGCRTILYTDPSLKASPAAKAASAVQPDFVVESLARALAIIEVEMRTHMPAILEADAEPVVAPPPPENFKEDEPAAINESDKAPAEPVMVITQPTVAEAVIPQRDSSEPEPVTAVVSAETAAAPSSESTPGEEDPYLDRLESLAREIVAEIRRHREQPSADFSITKLLAGISQILAIAALFIGWLLSYPLQEVLLFAVFLQVLTLTLLIMDRQR